MKRYEKTPSLTLRQVLTNNKESFLPLFPDGRCRRSEFAWLMLMFALLAVVWFLPQYILIGKDGEVPWFLLMIDGCFVLWFFWCVTSQIIRRIWDTRFRVYIVFMMSLAILFRVIFGILGYTDISHCTSYAFGLITIPYCFFLDSEKEKNPYGPSPKYVETE